jgi:hypothetical protein
MSANGERGRGREGVGNSLVIKRLQGELAQLREQLVERDRALAERDRALAERDHEISRQAEQIEKLERQLAARRRNSTNSSKPPSSDGMAGKQRRRCSVRKKSGKKPGGQPGHDGHERPLVDNPDRVEQVVAQECKHCGTALPRLAGEQQTMGEVFRRQILDLPPKIMPVVTEYQYPKLVCPCCQKGTRAELLARAPAADWGTADSVDRLSDRGAEDDAARRASGIDGCAGNQHQRGERAEGVGGNRGRGESTL